MTQPIAANYAHAQDRVRSGVWSVDASAGVIYSARGKPVGRINSSGYQQTSIHQDGRRVSVLIHRVIWESESGPIAPGMQVNHIDGDKLNNSIANLELLTPSENSAHAWRTGLCDESASIGDRTYCAKLSNQQARDICTRALGGESRTDLAREYGLSHPSRVSEIASGRKWGRVTADIRG